MQQFDLLQQLKNKNELPAAMQKKLHGMHEADALRAKAEASDNSERIAQINQINVNRAELDRMRQHYERRESPSTRHIQNDSRNGLVSLLGWDVRRGSPELAAYLTHPPLYGCHSSNCRWLRCRRRKHSCHSRS